MILIKLREIMAVIFEAEHQKVVLVICVIFLSMVNTSDTHAYEYIWMTTYQEQTLQQTL